MEGACEPCHGCARVFMDVPAGERGREAEPWLGVQGLVQPLGCTVVGVASGEGAGFPSPLGALVSVFKPPGSPATDPS